MLYAETSIDGVLPSFDKTYAYLLDEKDAGIQVGTRVLVPFGASNKQKMAIVTGITDVKPDAKRIKSVIKVVDDEPVITEEMLDLAFWIKERTFCTLFEVVKAMLPTGINYKTIVSFSLNEDADFDENELNENEKLIVNFFNGKKQQFFLADKISKEVGVPLESDAFKTLCKKNILFRNIDAARRVGDNMQKMIRLIPTENELKVSKKQQSVIDLLTDAGSASVKEVCYYTGVTQAVMNSLVTKGYAEFFEKEVYRTPFTSDEGELTDIILSEEQQIAFNGLSDLISSEQSNAALLYGVTGSGKTQVFLKLIDKTINLGKSVIVMVPEISLTPQTIRIFKKRYGKKIAVFHSALSMGERLDEYKRVKKKEATIAIGTRSAVFAPFENLGLIIMDEEQEHSYKSENSPRFHARDVAKFRCSKSNALLLLASATPSVETFANAKSGRYKLFTLSQRYGNSILPQVITVNLNQYSDFGKKTVISPVLADELKSNYEKGYQSIILLNRRGYNTFVTCKNCGEVVTCPNCSISMTYHTANRKLMCHYCGHSVPSNIKCEHCGSDEMKFNGVGTQKIEEELKLLLPDASILRMDADSTMSRFAFEEKFESFSKGNYDIMIGTQMVAKGLDFEKVTLVGIVCADNQLYNDDFRSGERTFSLLTQVIGRSGRGNFAGKAIIQTFSPDNEIIKYAEKQDYDSFYDFEIKIRKLMIYPPYCDLCVVGFVGENEANVAKASMCFLQMLKEKTASEYSSEHMMVLGPAPLKVAKVSKKYRYRLILKCHNSKNFRKLISGLLSQFDDNYKKLNVTVFADINPESTL